MSSGRQVHNLALLTLTSFIASFFAARTFTTIFPTTTVVTGGIHFHHFWYGLAMVVAAGWLAIVSSHPDLDRVFAIIFGLGAGLIGDEVGLLLTLGNYQSGLTYVFFVGVLSFSGIAYLLFRYRPQLEKGFLSIRSEVHLLNFGVFVAGLSAIAWAFDYFDLGVLILLLGASMAITGIILRRRGRRPAL
jgi:hypothetical protein